jgi:hypothetical protein
VSRTGNLSTKLNVQYTITGTASNGVDYLVLSGALTIPANESSAIIRVVPIDDRLIEEKETVIVRLSQLFWFAQPPPEDDYLVGTPNSALVTILDNDTSPPPPTNRPPTISIFTPANGSAFGAPADIAIAAEARDPDGWVATVEFFAGTNSLGIVTNGFAATLGLLPFPGGEGQGEGESPLAFPLPLIVANAPTLSVVTNNLVYVGANGGIIFFNGLTNSSPAFPFHVTWTNVPRGEYRLTAKATDNLGATATSGPVTVIVVGVDDLPVVSIRPPDNVAAEGVSSNGTINSGLVTVSRVGGPDAALTVFYLISGTASNGVDYLTLPDSTTIPAGTNSVSFAVTAIDDSQPENTEYASFKLKTNAAYRVGSPAVATVLIQDNDKALTNKPPTVAIVTPTNGAAFHAAVNILLRAEASDPDGDVLRVSFFAGDRLLGTTSNRPFSLMWSNVASGAYSISAKATDNLGGTGFSPAVRITVGDSTSSNQPPAIKITTPTNGASYAATAVVTIVAEAGDPDGLIRRIEFFANNDSIRLITNNSPAASSISVGFGWGPIAPGQYTLTARATDNLGATANSQEVHITVGPATPQPPVITRQPQDQSVAAGATARFSVEATGTAPLHYQWRSNEVAITGATSSVLEVANVTANQSGAKYSVVVSNESGAATSDPAVLTVLPPPPPPPPQTGAAVAMNNYDSHKPIQNADGSLASNAETYVQVWAGPVGEPLKLLSSSARTTTFKLSEPGFFDAGLGIVPDVTPGDPAQFQVRAWRGGTNFETASFRGNSIVFTQATGAVLPPPSIPNPAILLIPDPIVLQSVATQLVRSTGAWHEDSASAGATTRAPEIVAFSRLPGGESQLTIASDAGAKVTLQASTDLVHWESLGALNNPSGTLQVLDPGSAAHRHCFYRVLPEK